ncbi:hypothetical protein [Solilutibacter silvestris]|uniref:Uncharacterized protein n=1 Tax=Solilutibacter silvestris TaxID=1645665 RepID=A0A2K1Q1E7_9GAMM|nr:hypothetical protein [Lysobacter silvestris]PNS08869.1 hypothetical protein Lysil_0498 [Lysobacter silvestris]
MTDFPCTACTEEMGAYRARKGYQLCRKCYYKQTEHLTCSKCGRLTRILPTANPKLCGRCINAALYEGKTCKRCGRETLPHKRTTYADGTLACSACAVQLAPPKECHYCKKVSIRVWRDLKLGFTEPACPQCRSTRNTTPLCAGCRRPRNAEGFRDGKPYCKDCLPTGHPPVIVCVTCGKTKYGFSKTQCEDCAWEASHLRLLHTLKPQLQSVWARALFESYHYEARIKTLRGPWRNALKRDIAAFQDLESVFSSAEELSGVLIVRRLGHQFSKKYRRVMSFLSYMGYVVLDDDPDFGLELAISRIRALSTDDVPWIQAVTQDFIGYLLETRKKANVQRRTQRLVRMAKSIESAVRTAIRLLRYCANNHGAESVQDITQEMFEMALADKLHSFASGAFLRYHHKRKLSFHKLHRVKVPAPPIPTHLVYSEEERNHFLSLFQATNDPRKNHWALIAQLNLIYAQTIFDLVQLERSNVREADEGYEIRFSKVFIPLDESIVPSMQRWMTQRRERGAFDEQNTSRYLFPGTRSGTHIQSTAFQNYRNLHGYDARRGRVTAMANLVLGGIANPRILQDLFGISQSRGHMYIEQLGASQQRVAGHVMRRYGHQ